MLFTGHTGRPRVSVGWPYPKHVLDPLRELCDIQVNSEERILSKQEYLQRVGDKDIIFSVGTEPIDAEMMDAAPHLSMVANYAIGFNNIDVAEATRRKIVVTNTSGSATESTADFTWMLLMAVARRVVEADRFVREGRFHGVDLRLLLGGEVNGMTLGIIGLGRIGAAVARRARGFEMTLIYYDPQRASSSLEHELGVTYVPLDELLKNADFITVHVPLLPETRHLLGAPQFSLMKPTAYLVNTSRGPVIDEKALVKALQNRQIAGAGLDVYEHEPKMAEGLSTLDNVVLAPHIASSTVQARVYMAEIGVRNILAFCRGEIPPNLVNTEVLSAVGLRQPALTR